jgi:hypothetical protein
LYYSILNTSFYQCTPLVKQAYARRILSRQTHQFLVIGPDGPVTPEQARGMYDWPQVIFDSFSTSVLFYFDPMTPWLYPDFTSRPFSSISVSISRTQSKL